MMEDLGYVRDKAADIARAAGVYVLGRMGNLREMSRKSGINDLVTDVDRSSEKMIKDMIRESFPGHDILAEETGEETVGSDVMWIIDPLDGTTNFTHGLPVFCVSIGVAVNGRVVAGAVYDPSRDELFSAAEGEGAFLGSSPINVSRTARLGEALVVTGFAYSVEGKKKNVDSFVRMLERAQAVRRLGSAALDLCYVACGRFDAFWEMGLKPWDTAAGYLMVAEAGGKVSAIDGSVFDIRSGDLLATNGGDLHVEMISSL